MTKCPRVGVCDKAPEPEDADYVYRGIGYCHASCVRQAQMQEFTADNARRIEAARKIV